MYTYIFFLSNLYVIEFYEVIFQPTNELVEKSYHKIFGNKLIILINKDE